jgi:hypothetical protein
MKPLKSDIRKHALRMVENMTQNIFNELHTKYQCQSGDITLLQNHQLNEIKESLTFLVTEQVFQNLDFTKFSISIFSLERDELMELAYSLDWNGSWDADEEGQEPITKDELIEAILDLIDVNQ